MLPSIPELAASPLVSGFAPVPDLTPTDVSIAGCETNINAESGSKPTEDIEEEKSV